jgi:anti-sigma regulatory factor (Ser/Thr protein kinase)
VSRGVEFLDRLDDVASSALAELLALPGVRRVGLALSEGGGRRLRFTASDRDNRRSVDWCHIDAYDDVPLTTVVRTGEPVLGALEDLDRRYAAFAERQRGQGVAAVAALPLPGSASPMGGIVLFYDEAPAFDASHRTVLDGAAAGLATRLRATQASTPRDLSALADRPAAAGSLVADLVVDGDPRAVGTVRSWARTTLQTWGVADDHVDTVVLCLSELATNAVIHTRSGCEVRLVLDDGLVTGTVRDVGGAYRSGDDGSSQDPLRVHGRGLQLVDALVTRWSSEPDADGTTVWFALETST